MPVDKTKYPDNWKSIATAIKDNACWHCEGCDRPCRRPKQAWPDFVGELAPEWYEQTIDIINGEPKERPQRFTLTVAHLDHNTENNSPANLKALCSGCHLRYDAELHRDNAKATREKKRGQLAIVGV